MRGGSGPTSSLFLRRPELSISISTDDGSTVVDFAGIGGGDGSCFAEGRLKTTYFILPEFLAFLVLINDNFIFTFFFQFDPNDLLGQKTFFGSFQVSFVGLFAVFVLGLSGDFEIIGCFLGAKTHRNFVESIGEAIVGDHIEQFLVSVAESFPGLS